MISVEAADAVCMECGKEPESRAMSVGAGVGINAMKIVLCADCADYVSTKIQDKMSLLGCSTMSRAATTSELVAKFATYPLDLLLNELVMCTLFWNVGPLDADDRQVATAVMERLGSFGIAEKVHRPGCEIWTGRRLCGCPWKVPS
jgi:hypothetical protein